jgi:alpha-glucosidase (family GH31 glycosyl hydrolase)
MFGDEMLIAPVYKKGATKRKVHLPDGNWINFWTREKISGNQRIETEAPIHRIPVFIREGAIIPMRNYASSIEAGTNQVLHIHIYPGDDRQFTLIEDDGSSNDYLEGIYAKTRMKLTNREQSSQLLIEPTKGYYDQMKEERTWIFHIYHDKEINNITVNGEDMNFKENGKMTTTGKYTNNKYESTKVRITY